MGQCKAVGICPLRHTTLSVVRHSSCVALQFRSRHEQTTIFGIEDQSLRIWLCWTKEELARQMRWPIIWKERPPG